MGVPVEDPDAPLECCGRTFYTRSGHASHQRSRRQCKEHPDYDPDEARGPSQATKLIGLATNSGDVEYWHDADTTAWATIPIGDHVEHHRVRTRPFKRWLRHRYYKQEDGASPGSQALQDAVDHLDGVACFDGVEHDTHLRVAGHDGAVYLDLCDADWRVVEVTATGWRVITADVAPVRFERRGGMLALPEPEPGGSLDELRDFINCTDEDWPLVAGWEVAAVRPRGPYPALNLLGPHGAGKSTAAKVLRQLVDPNTADLRRPPGGERDFIITAVNGHVMSLENLSHLQPWLSDALASLATGSGFGTRALYEDDKESTFAPCRPIVMNGIEDFAVRADLLDRSLLVELVEIDDEDRQQEADFWAAFDKARPRILGALLAAVAAGLGNRDQPPRKLPRMADFAAWVAACAPALGFTADQFLSCYANNRASGKDLALESSIVGLAARDLVVDPAIDDAKLAELRQAWQATRERAKAALAANAKATAKAMKAWDKAHPRPGTWTGPAGDCSAC